MDEAALEAPFARAEEAEEPTAAGILVPAVTAAAAVAAEVAPPAACAQ